MTLPSYSLRDKIKCLVKEPCFQCPFCTGCPDCMDFQKVAELKDAGLVIYRHALRKDQGDDKSKLTNDLNTDGDKDDVFILQNVKDTEITASDFMSEFERKQVSCPRCRHIMSRAQVLLQNVSNIDKRDIKGVCDLCQAKQSNKTCRICDKVVKKFTESKIKSIDQEEKMKKRFQLFLGKIQNLLEASLEPEQQKVELKRTFSDINIDSLIERSQRSVHHLPEVDHLLFQPERPRTVPVSDVHASYLDDDDVASIIANKLKVKIIEKHETFDDIPRKFESFSSIQDIHDKNISLNLPQGLTSETVLSEIHGMKTGKYNKNVLKQKIKPSLTKRKEETEKHPPLRKYHSVDSLITSFSAITEDVLKKQLKYFFPKKKMEQKKQLISSVDLIRKTHDRLTLEADEKKKKEEELRRKKIEHENRKKQAREDKRLAAERKEKEIRRKELQSETEFSSDGSERAIDKKSGKRKKRTGSQTSSLSSEGEGQTKKTKKKTSSEIFDDETQHKRPKKPLDEDEEEKLKGHIGKKSKEGDKDRFKKDDASIITVDKHKGESRTKDSKEKVKGEKVGSEKLKRPMKTTDKEPTTREELSSSQEKDKYDKHTKGKSGISKDEKSPKGPAGKAKDENYRSDKDSKQTKDHSEKGKLDTQAKDKTGRSEDAKQAKDKTGKGDDGKQAKDRTGKSEDGKLAKDKTGKSDDGRQAKDKTGKSEDGKQAKDKTVKGDDGKQAKDKTGKSEDGKPAKDKIGGSEDGKLAKDKTGKSEDGKPAKDKIGGSADGKLAKDKTGKSEDGKPAKDKIGGSEDGKLAKDKTGKSEVGKPAKDKSGKNEDGKQTKDKTGKSEDEKQTKDKTGKSDDGKQAKDKTGKSRDEKQEKDQVGKGKDDKREKDLERKLQDKKPVKDQTDKSKNEIKGRDQDVKLKDDKQTNEKDDNKKKSEHETTADQRGKAKDLNTKEKNEKEGKDSASKVMERASKTSKDNQKPDVSAKEQTSAKSMTKETLKPKEQSAKVPDNKQIKEQTSKVRDDQGGKDISNKAKDTAGKGKEAKMEQQQLPKGDLSRKESITSAQKKLKGDQEAAALGKSQKEPAGKVGKGKVGLMDKEEKNKIKVKEVEKTGLKGLEKQIDSKDKQEKDKLAKGGIPEVDVKNIKSLKSQGDLILNLVKVKRDERAAKEPTAANVALPTVPIKSIRTRKKKITSPSSILSDLELDLDSLINHKTQQDDDVDEIIIGTEICHKKAVHAKPPPEILPSLFKMAFSESTALPSIPTEPKEEDGGGLTAKKLDDLPKGIIRYTLSDRSFIEKGWTMLPTEKVVRKMNVYRMRPAHPEFDWFQHNKTKGYMTYDSGEKLAEFDDNGRGRWYYRNGKLALDYYDCEEVNAQQRLTIYSSGEPDDRGRSRPTTVLAMFDYAGNGVVFDHNGKIRLKYNQTEGVLLDREIGPVSHWKWHSLNDPPILQQVMIDTHVAYKDPDIIQLGDPGDDKTRPDDEEMLAVEFDNFVKEKNKKSTQKYKPFQIKMKALKINENFSLRILDQASIYLLYRDGQTNLKLNLGMVLDNQEIVDTDTAELGEVSNNIERLPAATDSLKELQKFVNNAKRFDHLRTEHDQRYCPTLPAASVDKLHAPLSQPLRRPLTTVSPTSSENAYARRKPPGNALYYANRLI